MDKHPNDNKKTEVTKDASVNDNKPQGPGEIKISYRMYIFVNMDLGMAKGKTAAQVGHVVQYIVEDILRNYYEKRGKGAIEAYTAYKTWKDQGATKIILKANEKEMEDLSSIPSSRKVYDAGKTQIPSGSFTVLGFFPCVYVSEFDKFKLL